MGLILRSGNIIISIILILFISGLILNFQTSGNVNIEESFILSSRSQNSNQIKSVRINVSEDEMTGTGNDINYHDDTYNGGLRIAYWGSGWLKFDLSSIPTKAKIVSATMNLYLVYTWGSQEYTISTFYSSNDKWKETEITGMNEPSFNADRKDENTGPWNTGNWYQWNVTADVEWELTQNKILSEVIKSNSYIEAGFAEKDYNIIFAPFIRIEYYQISNNDFKLSDGDKDGELIYACKDWYTFTVNVSTVEGPAVLDKVTITIDPADLNLECSWDTSSHMFVETKDPNDYIDLIGGSSKFRDYFWILQFKIKFGLHYPNEKPASCKLVSSSVDGYWDIDFYLDVFRVENDLDFVGNLKVVSEKKGYLRGNEWLKNGDKIIFSGLKVVYQDTKDMYPMTGSCKIAVTDGASNSWEIEAGGDTIFNLKISAMALSQFNQYNVYSFSITPAISDISKLPSFAVLIDSLSPSAPPNLILKADIQTGGESYADSDGTVYLSWSQSVEEGSGLKGYYYNMMGGKPNFTTETRCEIINLDEGIHFFEIYAEDNVGYISNVKSKKIIIDKTLPQIYSIDISENEWLNYTPIYFPITFIDNLAGVDDGTIVYSVWEADSNEWSSWNIPPRIWTIENDKGYNLVGASVELFLPDGEKNYIKWRMDDLAGNTFESDSICILIDTKPVMFTDFSPTSYTSRELEFNITLEDTSGVSTCEFRFAGIGVGDYSEWHTLNIPDTKGGVAVTVPLTMHYGSTNRIQFRATDIAGNGLTISDEYLVNINSIPKVVINSPKSDETYKTSDLIEFDASGTFDEDNDAVTFYWESDVMGELGTSAKFSNRLNAGTHLILLKVTDLGGHVVNTTIKITIIPIDHDGDGIDDSIDTDDDGDGLPDSWELTFGLNPHKIDSEQDKDGDGFTNKEEYNSGTNPTNADSRPSGLSAAMVMTIINLVIALVVVIIVLGIGFILSRRQLKKKLIHPELISVPERKVAMRPVDREDIEVFGKSTMKPEGEVLLSHSTTRALPPKYQSPRTMQTPKELLELLDQKFILGEISEIVYKNLREKYMERAGFVGQGQKKVLKKKKKKKPPIDTTRLSKEPPSNFSKEQPEESQVD
jgi:hypothetical protein